MRNYIKLIGFIAFTVLIVFPVAGQSISGTFTYRATDGVTEVTFNGSNFTLASNGTTVGNGTFRVSNNRVFLNNSTSAFFTIVDANTIRDTDGDLWKNEAAVIQGTITINGLREHAGKYIAGLAPMPNNKTLFFCTEPPSASSVLGTQINRNGTITLNVYIVDHPARDIRYNTAVPYSGSDNLTQGRLRLFIIGTPNFQTSTDDIQFENSQDIPFRNGDATINFTRAMRRQ